MSVLTVVVSGAPVVGARPIPRVVLWMPLHFEPSYARQQVRAIARRTAFTAVDIDTIQGATTVGHGQTGGDLLNHRSLAFARATAIEGRRDHLQVGLNLDFDRALASYFRAQPRQTMSRVEERIITLDPQGRAAVTVSGQAELRRLVSRFPAVRSVLLRAWAYRPASGETFAPGSLSDITRRGRTRPAGRAGVTVLIDAGARYAGRRVFVLTRHEYRYPDQFSRALLAFQGKLVAAYARTGITLATLDEMGLPNEPTTPGATVTGTGMATQWREPWYSKGLVRLYQQRTHRDYLRDVLYQRVPPADHLSWRIRGISAYYDTLRAGTVRIEHAFYRAVKRELGVHAFVGVHPTWNTLYPSIIQYDFWRNGLDWWDIPRDFSQADEGASTATRLGLARRDHSPITTNQVYGPSIDGYLTEARYQAPSNGRINYDGSYGTDGPTGGGVLSNVMSGSRPEQIARIERPLALLDQAARALPKPTALVVFGYYSQAAWMTSNPTGGDWPLTQPGANTADQASEIARALTAAGYTVDLIPSTEVDNRHVTVDGTGHPVYAGQHYHAAVLAYPEYSRQTTLRWAARVQRLAVVGAASWDADGHPDGRQWRHIARRARLRLPALNAAPAPTLFFASPNGGPFAPGVQAAAARIATRLGLARDPVANGSLLADGGVLVARWTTTSVPRLVRVRIGHHRVTADVGDLFAAHLDARGRLDRAAGQHLRWIAIDGHNVVQFRLPADVALLRAHGFTVVFSGARPRGGPRGPRRSLTTQRAREYRYLTGRR